MLINSADNQHFKLCKSLLGQKGVKKNQLCLVSGRKIVPEFLAKNSTNSPVQKIIVSPKNSDCLKSLPLDPDQIVLLHHELFQEIDTLNTRYPLLVCKAPEISNYDLSKTPEGLEVICSLGDPNNLGALLRSCEAFGVSKVILLKNASHPFLPKAIKASSGSAFRLPLFSGPFIEELPAQSFYALDKKGENIYDFAWPKNLRILMGEEGPGHPNHQPVQFLSVPMKSGIESLNAMVATSIVLSQFYSHSLSVEK